MLDPTGAHARRTRVTDHFDHLLIADPDNLLWLTGLWEFGGPAYLFLSDGIWFLIVPESAGFVLPHVEMISYASAAFLPSTLRPLLAAPSLSIDTPVLDRNLDSVLGELNIRDAAAAIEALRQIKDADEISLIRENVALLNRALRTLQPMVHTAATEAVLWRGLEVSLAELTDGQVELIGNLASGEERTRQDDPRASERSLQDGDVILLDAYPRIRGYYADLTRTWCRGNPPRELARMHAGVAASLKAVGASLRPGLRGHEVDTLAREVLVDQGLDASFPHHTGHGFGVKQQEEPWLRSGSETVLQANMVVAIEPACYTPGVGGVRLEQDFLITETGALPLGDEQFSLEAATHV